MYLYLDTLSGKLHLIHGSLRVHLALIIALVILILSVIIETDRITICKLARWGWWTWTSSACIYTAALLAHNISKGKLTASKLIAIVGDHIDKLKEANFSKQVHRFDFVSTPGSCYISFL